MTKSFCDLCGEPANKNATDRELVVNHGAPREEYGAPREEYSVVRGQRMRQSVIVARIVFIFRDHPTNFGGPPDLCAKCAANLVRSLADKVERA